MSTFLAIVSDTHGQTEFAQRAVRMLGEFAPVAVLHCGDIGSTAIPPLFAPWPTYYVFGNVDLGLERQLTSAITAANRNHKSDASFCANRFGELTLYNRHIAWLHGDDSKRLAATIASQKYDLVCSGHTHVYDLSTSGKTLVLNPGALYRARQHTCAIVDLETLDVTRLVCD
jgi:putative phosphoesterase